MAVGTLSSAAAAPAVAAAIGAYFFGRHHSQHKVEGRFNPSQETVAKENEKGSKAKKKEVDGPRFALELDGLHCFETLVSH